METPDPKSDATETFRLDPNDRPLTGTVGKYELYELLGAGSMGTVYRATDPKLNREVAVKLMTPAVASDPDLRDRFHREAQTAGSLQHPNIITIFEFGEADDRLYIAMEYVEGRDLSRIIRSHEAMTLLEKLGVALDVLAGLEYAHGRQITHRDIKPGNIRLTIDGRAKIMDFGIAHLQDSELTGTGLVLGTPSYMAPESLKGDPPSPQGDVYSVGAVLYELIAYRKPFEGSTQQEVLYRVLSDDPTPLSELDPNVPKDVEAIVGKAMAKDPAERYASTTELAADLKHACVSLHTDTGSTVVQNASLPSRTSSPRWGWTVAAALGVILLSWGGSRLIGEPESAEATAPVAAVAPSVEAQPDTLLLALRDAALARRFAVERAGVPPADMALGDALLAEADSLADLGRFSDAVLRMSEATNRWGAAENDFVRREAIAAARQSREPPPPEPEPAPVRTLSRPVRTPPAPVSREPVRTDASEITRLVEQLSRALESRNVDRLRAIYPGLTEGEATVWRRFFRDAVQLNMDLEVGQLVTRGDSASAQIEGVYTYETDNGTQRQPMSFPAEFVRVNGRWQLRHLGSTGS